MSRIANRFEDSTVPTGYPKTAGESEPTSIYSRTCAIGNNLHKANDRLNGLVRRLEEHRDVMHGSMPSNAGPAPIKDSNTDAPIPVLTGIERRVLDILTIADRLELLLTTIV